MRKILCIVFSAVILSSCSAPEEVSTSTSFEECAAAGNPILQTYPAQCKTPDGQTFVEKINPVNQPAPFVPQ